MLYVPTPLFHHIILDFMELSIFGKSTNCEAAYYVILLTGGHKPVVR
jgi:hypothetical protein